MQKIFAAALLLAAIPASAANLVVNGDFEAGNSGFTSDYGYVAPGPNAMYPEGLYTVDTDAFNSHNLWASFGDHTTGSGLYMIVNGAADDTKIVWQSGPFAISAGTDYFFEAFAAEICCNLDFTGQNFPANLTFEITDNFANTFTLDTFTTAGHAPGDWIGLSNVWNSGAATSVTLRILNSSTEASGNDFALDDINFSTRSIVVPGVPEPAAWAMMLGGFALVGISARRRRMHGVTA